MVHADEARADQVDVMLRDAYVMKGVSHDNVSCVVMTCLDQRPLLIYSDVTGAGCNLKTFLQRCNMSEVGPTLLLLLLLGYAAYRRRFCRVRATLGYF